MSLKRVYFRYDESNLSTQEKIALNGVVDSFRRDTQSVIELRGYTDGMESLHSGTTLGITRSQTIARYFMASGIPAKSILVVPTNGISDDERSMNPEHRRVDVRLFTPAGSGESGTYSALNTNREPAKPPKGA
ncbi:MAG: OmpA family protein [Acidobacteriaceae bacterium]|nr:OmpA family protein [Acidobacteriaceae bacterium]